MLKTPKIWVSPSFTRPSLTFFSSKHLQSVDVNQSNLDFWEYKIGQVNPSLYVQYMELANSEMCHLLFVFGPDVFIPA